MPIHSMLTLVCKCCGGQRIMSSFIVGDDYFIIITCVECDAPSPGPFNVDEELRTL